MANSMSGRTGAARGRPAIGQSADPTEPDSSAGLAFQPGDPMAERDRQIMAIAGQFPGWEAWQSLDGQWHARIVGAIPPVMVHAASADELREQIRGRAT